MIVKIYDSKYGKNFNENLLEDVIEFYYKNHGDVDLKNKISIWSKCVEILSK